MKKLFLIALMLFTAPVFAQQKHNPADQIQSLNWDVIGTLRFNLTDKNELFPVFSESIERFAGREFDLTGYLIPIKSGRMQQKFLLSTLPVNQCYFCGKNGIPVMIMIEMKEAINFSDKPIRVRGTLKVYRVDASVQPPIVLKDAKLLI